MNSSKCLAQIVAAIACCLVLALSGNGQDMAKGQVEATGQVGLVTGIGTHPSIGGNVGVALNERVFAFGEFGWIPFGGSSTSGTNPGGSFEFSSSARVLTFMLGAHYQFREARSFIPYAGAALGGVRASGSVTSTIGGNTTETNVSSSNLYVSFGGGARYYMNDRWGFKPEFMIFAGNDVFVRLGGGIFYQFGR